MATSASDRTNILEIDLPEISERNPYTVPRSHLVKTGNRTWAETAGRRLSKTLMVNRIREAVDAWRADGYPGASATTLRLLQFWFEETHFLGDRTAFRYFFGQREAIETIIYLYEVKGFRDCFDMIAEYFEAAKGAQLELGLTMKGRRKIRRYIPEIAKDVEQDVPREGLVRMAVKMATGAGKTVVMALVMVWSYLHRRFEPGSDLAENFLLIAPNVIVFERLKLDFEGGRIFNTLPLVPPEWRGDWQVDAILRGEARMPKAAGNLFVTNIQQIYEREPVDAEPINPVAALLGNKPSAKIHAPVPMLDRVRTLSNLMVLNDEAHHLWEDVLEWNKTLLDLDDHFKHKAAGGLVAWLDFTATPKRQGSGSFFPWIVVDYPLAQAVEDRIVKTPLIIHQTDRKDPDKYAHEEAGDVYNEWIAIAVARWREHVKDYGSVGERPILFVMAETTKDADSITERLEREEDLKGKVLRIHTDRFGEVSKKEEDKIRREAREIDSGRSRYRAVVSVLMLREGWDVRNVSVILGLRPFSAKTNILPEQAVGRGLRLMRKIPMGNTQILELIGTQAFEDFVRELEKEGLGVGTVRTPPNPGKRIYPADERSAHDIEIPRTTALFEREFKNIEALDPLGFGPIGSEEDLGADLKQKIELIHGTVDVTVHSDEVVFDSENVPPVESLLASLTNRVMRRARITGFFPQLYPKVRAYVRERCFGGRVELDEISVRRALNDSALMDGIASLFSRRIGELTAEKRAVKVAGDPWRLGGTDEFLWRRHFTVADKTVFNVVACFNAFEADFAHFLDKAPDVVKFAKLCEHFTGFHIQYLKTGGALGTYYPDFAVVQQKDDGRVNWIVETKGQEDVEVAAKDEQMKRWCAEVTAATGILWRYAKVPYRVFHGKHFSSFNHLVRVLSGETGQLVLPLAGFARTDSDSGPPDAVVELFWNRFGPKVPASAIVLASREALAPEGVQDVLNQPLSFKVMKTRAFLFFVDLEPEANWAHACAYAFVAETGETAWCDARWPPQESISLIRKGRP
jgi:type III restriction enzyme